MENKLKWYFIFKGMKVFSVEMWYGLNLYKMSNPDLKIYLKETRNIELISDDFEVLKSDEFIIN